MKRFVAGAFAYLVPTFALAYVWHLVLFEPYYQALGIYRSDIVIPFGFVSMVIQAVGFAWIYANTIALSGAGFWARTSRYGVVGALLSWSFTTLAVAAKNVMSSVPDYVLIESLFTLAQWALVAPLTVWAFGEPRSAPYSSA